MPDQSRVQRDRVSKYCLRSVAFTNNEGFNPRELRVIRDEIIRNLETIQEA